MVSSVAVIVPAKSKLPKIGDADKVAQHVTASIATNSDLPIVLPRIQIVFILPECANVRDANRDVESRLLVLKVSCASTIVIVLETGEVVCGVSNSSYNATWHLSRR
jgi:hypothetical protein